MSRLQSLVSFNDWFPGTQPAPGPLGHFRPYYPIIDTTSVFPSPLASPPSKPQLPHRTFWSVLGLQHRRSATQPESAWALGPTACSRSSSSLTRSSSNSPRPRVSPGLSKTPVLSHLFLTSPWLRGDCIPIASVLEYQHLGNGNLESLAPSHDLQETDKSHLTCRCYYHCSAPQPLATPRWWRALLPHV